MQLHILSVQRINPNCFKKEEREWESILYSHCDRQVTSQHYCKRVRGWNMCETLCVVSHLVVIWLSEIRSCDARTSQDHQRRQGVFLRKTATALRRANQTVQLANDLYRPLPSMAQMCSGWQDRKRKRSGRMSALGKVQIQSRFSLFDMIVVIERKEGSIYLWHWTGWGGFMSELSRHACSAHSSGPRHDLTVSPVPRKSPLWRSSREGGVSCALAIIYTWCCTDVWRHSLESFTSGVSPVS